MAIKVLVDWANDNDFDDAIDDITSDVMEAGWRLGFREAYQDIADENQATIVVKNTDGKYNPENSSSALYPNVLPHRRMKIQDVTGAGTTALWTGWIEVPETPWQPSGAETGQITATITGIGAKSLLQNLDVPLEIQSDVTGDVIIDQVLAAANLPAVPGSWRLGIVGFSELGQTTYLGGPSDYSAVETGITIIDDYGDQETNNGYRIIQDVTQAERGRFFFDRLGKAIWWNRHHQILDYSNDGTAVTDSGSYKAFRLDYAYGGHLANSVRIRAMPRKIGTSETLWELDAPIKIKKSRTIEFDAILKRSTGQEAGATTLVATPTWSKGSGTVTVEEQGNKAHITATNLSSTSSAILETLTLTGAPTTDQNMMEVEVSDTDSLIAYGKREIRLSLGPVGNFEDAEGVARFELRRRKDPRGDISTIQWRRQFDGSDNAHILSWPIGTRLNVNAASLSHNADYYVIGEEHNWKPGASGGIHDAALRLEPLANMQYWLLGIAGYSELGQTTYLGY